MAKIVFVQPLVYEYPGTEQLSASLLKAGHTTDLLIHPDPKRDHPALAGADLLAFSLMTGYLDWALKAARELKAATGARTIFGGPHPTHCPEMVAEPDVDAVCRGEGEEALVELADGLDNGVWDTSVKNLWVKEGGKVSKNPLRPALADLDMLPSPDRDLYYRRHPALARGALKPFVAGRGCPFECVFCSNRALRDLYGARGSFVRMKSPAKLVAEIQGVRDAYGLKKLIFHDDTFTVDRRWTEEFLDLYRTRVNLPFHCQSRADTLTHRLCTKLKAAGCRTLFFAVETGVERLRKEVLKKNLSDAAIREGARMVKAAGIALSTYNMLGIPGETLEDAFETVRLNAEIGADYPRVAFPTPYPGTELFQMALEIEGGGTVPSITPFSQQSEACFVAEKERGAFVNLHSLFQFAVLFPSIQPAVRRLVKLPLGPAYRFVWALTYLRILLKSEGRGLLDTLSLAVSMISLRFWRNG